MVEIDKSQGHESSSFIDIQANGTSTLILTDLLKRTNRMAGDLSDLTDRQTQCSQSELVSVGSKFGENSP